MSEKFSSKQEREDAVDSIKDFVHVDKNGKAHVPAGSGRKSGKFLSDHEVAMIEAHSEQIYEGDAAREAQNMLKNTVGVLTDPKDIRESLYVNAYIDDEEYEDLSDDEILQYVADARTEAGYDVDEPQQKKSETAEYSPKHRAEVNNGFAAGDTVTVKRTSGDIESDWQVRTMYGDSVEVAKASPDGNGTLVKLIPIEDMQALNQRDVAPKHRADTEESEDTPVFDELRHESTGVASEGESLEEYEQRQGVRGRRVNREGLELVDGGKPQPTPVVGRRVNRDGLEKVEEGSGKTIDDFGSGGFAAEVEKARTEEEAKAKKMTWREKLTPAGAMAALQSRRFGKHEKEESANEHSRKKKIIVALAGVGLFAAGLGAAIYSAKHGVENPLGHGGGHSGSGSTGAREAWDSLSQHAADAADKANPAPDVFGQPFDVEYTHGFIKEWQDWGSNHGVVLSDEKAEQLHKHLLDIFGKDGLIDLDGVKKAAETYTENGDVRIGAPGTAHWRDGVEQEAINWLQAH